MIKTYAHLIKVRFTFISLLFIALFFALISFPLKTYCQNPTEADERSKEIERLKTELQKIKEEQQKQIEELETETQKEREKEYVEPSKPPKEVEEAPATTYVIEWWKNIEVVAG